MGREHRNATGRTDWGTVDPGVIKVHGLHHRSPHALDCCTVGQYPVSAEGATGKHHRVFVVDRHAVPRFR